jgi:GTPase SAR1 family protein
VDFRDTAGQERYRSMTGTYFRDVTLAIFAYEIPKLASLDAIMSFYLLFKENAPSDARILLVGLKSDIACDRGVTAERAEMFAKKLDPPADAVIAVSSVSGAGIDLLKEAIEDSLSKVERKTKSTVELTVKSDKHRKGCC